MNDRRVEVLRAATRRRRENAEKAVQKAIREARKTSAPITITAIAAAARVSTDFIYRHPVLRPQVEALRRSHRTARPEPADHPDAQAVAESTLVRRLTQQLATERTQTPGRNRRTTRPPSKPRTANS